MPVINRPGHSLKLRVLGASAAVLVLFFCLMGLAVLEAYDDSQYQAMRRQLSADANVLLTAARVRDGKLVMPSRLPDEKFNKVESRVLGLIYDRHGNLLWRSRSTLDEDQLTYVPNFNVTDSYFGLIASKNGKDYFVYDIDLVLGSGSDTKGLVFVTMEPALEYQTTLDIYRRALMSWLSGTGAIILIVFWLAMYWSLRPLKDLAQNLKMIEVGSNDRLVGVYPFEIARVTNALNLLLSNEKKQRERYRDTMADLAHSLKTPLAVLQSVNDTLNMKRGYLRNGKAQPVSDDELVEISLSIDEQVQRMNQIIGYQLQRAVIRHKPLVRNSIPAMPVVERLCHTLDKVYRDKNVRVSRQAERACHFMGNEPDLMEILGNLLENAYKLCLQNVQINLDMVVSVDDSGNKREQLMLAIEDDGPGVPEARRDEILRRGVRADSRTAGQGLGLSMVMDIIDSYGGSLSVSDSSLGGARFTVKI